MKLEILGHHLMQCTHFTDDEVAGPEGLNKIFTTTLHLLGRSVLKTTTATTTENNNVDKNVEKMETLVHC